MKLARITSAVCITAALLLSSPLLAAKPLQYDDVFELEFVSDPQPDSSGKNIVFVRNWMDRSTDRRRTTLWLSSADGKSLQALTDKNTDASSPRWAPDNNRIAFIADGQIHLKWLDSGRTSQLGQLQQRPANLSWSPDGNWLAFTMFTPKSVKPPVALPGKPEKADWAKAPVYIDSKQYRADGAGYLQAGYQHIYLMPANGGSAIQLTDGDFNHGGAISWARDSKAIYFSANRHADWQAKPLNSEIFQLTLADRTLTQLTDRNGPDAQPQLSPDGKLIAYVGFDDRKLAHQANRLYVMNADGSNIRNLTEDLDRAIDDFQWQANSKALYIAYDNEGKGVLAEQAVSGKRTVLAEDLGGSSYSRPYSGGQFAAADNGLIAYTQMHTQRPAELAVINKRKKQTLTSLNDDLLFARDIGEVEEFWYGSSVDQRKLQGWLIYPPKFDASKKYPLILEIHGGPHTAYGPHFAMELQLMAAQGYVVLYTNPRGSTSYGEEFANLIHHNYPSQDFNDLMDGVDAVLSRGFINDQELFITGGSGGGVLTTWSIAHTDRFAAAVAVNPVINWFSFVLNADMYSYFSQYWFPGLPWEMPEHYLKHSPIAHVGKVNTPTMLFTGESDHRTPISETEQYYQALQLRGVETAMVRVPGASHALHTRPSNLMAKPAYIVYWFNKYRQKTTP
ncbi:alpha/beta hydrolase family protein [Rheinheimera nanhaiensis]|uniref:Acylaminoacyl-peptidase n=1 Tax=Rheinheimera nanhaiensis E407-8 TaxID=562729 RepID=I1E2D8_9GAMM|nr:S9 family peptidase [Rheinheimera nanhaiensis]GAB60466.1 acylaminoacyl-peptidase [Rheinheimera nanhaiensis E407-8]